MDVSDVEASAKLYGWEVSGNYVVASKDQVQQKPHPTADIRFERTKDLQTQSRKPNANLFTQSLPKSSNPCNKHVKYNCIEIKRLIAGCSVMFLFILHDE